MAPASPPERLLRVISAMEVEAVVEPLRIPAKKSNWRPRRGFAQGYDCRHVLRSLQVSVGLGNQGGLRQTLEASALWLDAQSDNGVAAPDANIIPGANTLRRHILQVDMAAMLANRQLHAKRIPTFRYVAFDASPQRGVEFFVTAERVVGRVDVERLLASALPPVRCRMLPLNVLGCGRMGLAEKTQTHIHQVWLDYGPSIADVRAANACVRQCLSDMGTELGIADARDCVSEAIGQKKSGPAPAIRWHWSFLGRSTSWTQPCPAA